MVQDVGFWEAVGLWWGGQKLEDFTMYGWPMLWWARMGKYLQFIGGAVVVLDLIGPERFRLAALKVKRRERRLFYSRARIHLSLLVIGVMAVLTVIHLILGLFEGWISNFDIEPSPVAVVVVVIGYFLVVVGFIINKADSFLRGVARVLSLGHRANLWKWISFVLIVIGFHLDLLGS